MEARLLGFNLFCRRIWGSLYGAAGGRQDSLPSIEL